MIGENTHEKQTTASYDILSITMDSEGNDAGVAPVRITVLNEEIVTVKTSGVKHSQFADLRYDVMERLVMAGYNVDRLDIEL